MDMYTICQLFHSQTLKGDPVRALRCSSSDSNSRGKAQAWPLSTRIQMPSSPIGLPDVLKPAYTFRFTIVSRPKEGEMVATIGELSQSHQFVLIDLEGTASRLLSRAFARSSLVLIPLNPSPIDARLAASAVQTRAGGRRSPGTLHTIQAGL